LRCDLAFRQLRKVGAPSRPGATHDRDGLRSALQFLANIAPAPLYLGGHSYGGRQSSMLAAEDGGVAAGLLLLSYPLHPPRRPSELRTTHFPKLHTRSLFVHGERDPFGAPEELQAALALIPAETSLVLMPRAGHELISKNPETAVEQAGQIVAAFQAFVQ
jgi:predicted alpha/beta-hydrolase family hydrolase